MFKVEAARAAPYPAEGVVRTCFTAEQAAAAREARRQCEVDGNGQLSNNQATV